MSKHLSLQELREKRAHVGKSLHDLVHKVDWNDATDQPLYDQGMAEIESIDRAINRIEAANAATARKVNDERAIEAMDRAARDTRSEGAKLYAKWLRHGETALSAEEWQTIRNTMSTTTGSEGGFTVATEVASSVLDALKAYGGMRAVAEVIRTSQGNPMNFPTSDGTSETGEIVAENGSSTAADIVFGTKALPVYAYSSKVVTVPWQLLQDSSVDVEAFVRQRLVDRLGRITNTHFTTGTGTSQPNGIITAATTGVTAANSTSQVTAIIYDSIIDLIHSVDPAYRARGNCKFMMNDASVKVLRKIKDGQSRPIFVPGYETGVPGGAPDTLCGYPIQINQDVAVMAASAKSIAFGDFSYYKIRDVMEMTMLRYTDSAYSKQAQVGFQAWLRSGGNFIDVGGAVKLFVNAAS